MSQGNIKQLRSSLSLDFTLGPSQTKKVKYDNFFLESPGKPFVLLSHTYLITS